MKKLAGLMEKLDELRKEYAGLIIVIIVFGLGAFLGPTIMSHFNRQKDLKATLSPDGQQLANLYQNLNSLKVDIAKFEKQKSAKQKELANQQTIIKFATELTSSTNTSKPSQPISIGSTDYTLQQIKEDIKVRQEQGQKLSQEISQKNKSLSDFKKLEAMTTQLAEHSRSNLEISGQEEEIKKAELAALLSDPQIKMAVSKKRGSLHARLDTANQAFSQKLKAPLLPADILALTSLIDWNSQISIPTEHWLAQIKKSEEKEVAVISNSPPTPAPHEEETVRSIDDSQRELMEYVNRVGGYDKGIIIPPAPRQTPVATPTPDRPLRSQVTEDVVTAVTTKWTESEVSIMKDEIYEFGPVPHKSDIERLRVRSGGAGYAPLEPVEVWDGRYVARVRFISDSGSAPLRLKVLVGEPLPVEIKRYQ